MFEKLSARLLTFLYYNKAERNGIIVLALLLLVFFSGLYFYEEFAVNDKIDRAAFFAKVDSIENALQEKPITIDYFSFNPNTADSSTLRRLGFSSRQIRNLKNYRRAGGIFRKKEDFQKLYFVNDSIYKVYESYLFIPQKKEVENAKSYKKFTKVKKDESVTQISGSLFMFNPNTITKEQWKQLGVSGKISTIIQNYLSKGGYFYKKEDLKKIYGLSDATYARLESYIVIPKKEKAVSMPDIYDLNTVTQEDLQKLKLNKSMARKVVKYREKLGGYAQMSQLLQVYNMNEYSLNLLKKHCKIKNGVKQIDINTADVKALSKHHYLSYRDAEAIVRYRSRKGKYKSIEDLKTHKILTDKVFEMVKFYLKVKN